ncbi:MAG TPA: RHS repeat-associated core domain-containing protein [Anaerolineales bacterium]|nr:RHS repeat-associated core domain-containing protein [Anaerolineales bacterium]
MGGLHEVTGTIARKYYSIASMTIAVNDGTGLTYLLTDQLGSVVAVANSDGSLASQQRYMPFGQVRTDVTSPNPQSGYTDFSYTGQRSNSYINLIDYKSRWYSADLGRFVSPDDIVPDLNNPQSLNKYSYVNNDPVNATDPTGHKIACDDGYLGSCGDSGYSDDPSQPASPPSGGGGDASDRHSNNGKYNFRGYSDEQLASYLQYQGYDGSGCGPYSIAMAANLFGDKNLLGGNVQNDLESWVWRKVPGYGMPTWSGFGQDLSRYTSGQVDQYSHATISDLQGAILNDKLPVVAVSWQTTGQILADPLHSPVGHYMVAVGFDKTGISFLNPAMSQGDIPKLDHWMYQEFNDVWNGKSNAFITAGTMYTISP